MKRAWLLVISSAFAVAAVSSPFARAEGEPCAGVSEVTLGCTANCEGRVQNAILEAARRMHVTVHLRNLIDERVAAATGLEGLDGVVSRGGEDIEPSYFAEGDKLAELSELDRRVHAKHTPEGDAREQYEKELFERYFSDDRYRDLPVLGICFGGQMMAVVKKLPMVIDIQDQLGIPNRRNVNDRISLTETGRAGSIAEQITDGAGSMLGYEDHHQAIDTTSLNTSPRDDVRVTATSNGGRITEVLEYRDRPAISVQFHPEWSKGPAHDGVFSWLLSQACEKRRRTALAQAEHGTQALATLEGPARQNCETTR